MAKVPMWVYDMITDCAESAYTSDHMLVNHSYRLTDDDLKKRIRREKISAASRFSKEVFVADIVASTIEESPELIPWVMDSNSLDEIKIYGEYQNIGVKFEAGLQHNWEEGAIVCNQICIVIKKERNAYGLSKLVLLTAYPV